MQRVLILGAGGHAQVVADILHQMAAAGADIAPTGFLDDNPATHGRELLGLPVLGAVGEIERHAPDAAIIGIGSNGVRCALYQRLRERGVPLAQAVHPRAIVAGGVTIGPGSVLCAGAIVNTGCEIGANVILNTGCTVDHHNLIGDHAHIAPGAHLGGDVRIGEGAFVGISATVMPQRRVGAWSTVGAGGLVHRDLPERVVAIGVPARIVRQ